MFNTLKMTLNTHKKMYWIYSDTNTLLVEYVIHLFITCIYVCCRVVTLDINWLADCNTQIKQPMKKKPADIK